MHGGYRSGDAHFTGDILRLNDDGSAATDNPLAGALARLAEYKSIETTSLHAEDFPNLQQFRWAPGRIAYEEPLNPELNEELNDR
jgi:hypothetical protein